MAYIKNDSAIVLVGTSLDDTLDSTYAPSQELYGGFGNDVYRITPGFAGSSDLVFERAGEGIDTIVLAGIVDSFLTQTLAAEVENLILQPDNLYDDAELYGNALNNVITGGARNDLIDGGAGNDTMNGGLGNDTYYVDSAGDIVNDVVDGGYDQVISSVTHVLAANLEDLILTGHAVINGTGNAAANYISGNIAANTLSGGGGNDDLYGGDGNDTLNGDAGDDWLDGGMGNDVMNGGAGDDAYVLGAGDSVVEALGGGQDRVYLGDDVYSYVLAANVEDFYLTTEWGMPMGGKSGTGNALDNFIMGTVFGDTLVGAAGNDTLDGHWGGDIMQGGLGNDIYVVDDWGDQVTELLNEGVDTVYSGIDWTLGANVENLVLTGTGDLEGVGNALNNVLTGNAGSNWLWGGAGNDVLDGRGSNDAGHYDQLFGGAGNDTYYLGGTSHAWEQNNQGIDTVISSVSLGGLLYANVENLILVGNALVGSGNGLANVITGNALNNDLSAGSDAVVDTLAGGLGDDIYRIGSGDIVSEAAGAGTDSVYFSGPALSTHVLAANVEHLFLTPGAGDINGTGNATNNDITGNSGVNVLDGGAGNDRLYGGAGNDTLIGGIGDDLLNGQSGGDLMKGGAGNDTYYVTSMSDVADESTAAAGGGIDTIVSNLRTTDLNDTAVFKRAGGMTGAGVIENITLDFSAVDAKGNELANVIRGNAGVNRLEGRDGNDTYYVDLRDTVVETNAATTQIDTVVIDVDAGQTPYTGMPPIYLDLNTTYANVENMTLLGTGNYGIRGTIGNNILIGNSGNNWIAGGLGNDTMTGGAGNDVYQVDNLGDKVNEQANEGTDTVVSRVTFTLGNNVENLRLTGTGNLNGTGNVLDNQIEGNGGNNILAGNDGNDKLYGRTGNDTLTGGNGNDVLDGGYGNDTMTGGAGDDEYWVDSTGDIVNELAGQGTDKVVFRGDTDNLFTLGATQSIEILQADNGTAALELTGNASANTLIGNAGNNILTGGGGNDVFDGGAGNDTLVGGAGSDVFNFGLNLLDYADSVTGNGGSDVLNASYDGFTGSLGTVVGVQTIGITATGGGSSDLNFAGVSGTTSVIVTGTQGFTAEAVGDAGGSNIPAFTLRNFTGSELGVVLQNSSGSDYLTINLDNAHTAVDTAGIEALNFNVLGNPAGGNNDISVSFVDVVALSVSGAGALSLTNLDQTLLTPGTQEIGLNAFAGGIGLALQDASGGADSVTLDTHDSNVEVFASGIESFTVDTGIGASISNIRLAETDAGTVIVQGDSKLIVSFDGSLLDATGFTGEHLWASTFAVGGSTFEVGKSGVSANLMGWNGNDTFDFQIDGTAASIDNTDFVRGGNGWDTVLARIDGLSAGTTGRLRFENVEDANFTNNAGAGIDGTWMGGGTLYLNGNAALDTGPGRQVGDGAIDMLTGLSNGLIDTVIYNLSRDLNASIYQGDLFVLASNTGVGRSYIGGTGNMYLFGSAAFGSHDTFTLNADYDGEDFIEGFDIDNAMGGDVLNATLSGLSGAAGQLRTQGVETLNFELDGSNVIDAAGIHHAYTLNLLDTGGSAATDITLTGFDANGILINGLGLMATMDVTGGAGNDVINGGDGANAFDGGAGNDQLFGGMAGDALSGGSGNDFLSGGAGADTLAGDAGDDRLVGGDGVDAFDGVTGNDEVDFSGEGGAFGVTVTLTGTVAGGTATDSYGNAGETLINIDRIVGTAQNDSFTGSTDAANNSHRGMMTDTNESYEGMGGDDFIDGGGSGASWGFWDTATYMSASSGVYGYLGNWSGGATITVNGHVIAAGTVQDGLGGLDTLYNIDSLRGGDWDDILVGGSQSISIAGTRFESFIGGKGNDFIAGNGNAAEMGAVTNGDVDRVDYQFDPSSVLVTLGGGWARDGWGNTDTLRDINMVRGSNYSDSLFGGNPNNDYFEGFEGLRGDDIIDGLGGTDRVDYAFSPTGVTVNLALGFALDGWGGQDSLFNIEQARGSDFNDTLIGDAGNNSFIGGAGNDTLDGGAGNDQANYRTNDYDVDGDGLGVVVNLGAVTLAPVGDTWEGASFGPVLAGHAIDSWGGDDTLISIEDVSGSVYNDVIVGSAAANVIDSGYGNDKLTGGGGADIFHFGQPLNWGGSPLPASNNVDTITDFTTGSDKLRLDDAVFTSLTGFTAANFKTGTGSIVLDGNDYLYFDTSSGNLYYDSDGSTGGGVLFAVLNGGTAASLAATDIMVV